MDKLKLGKTLAESAEIAERIGKLKLGVYYLAKNAERIGKLKLGFFKTRINTN